MKNIEQIMNAKKDAIGEKKRLSKLNIGFDYQVMRHKVI